MASRESTVDDLISQVRSQIDEENTETINDEDDILPALNRAQDYAFNILARHYEEPLLKKAVVTLTQGTQEYDIPEDAFEDRIEKFEIEQNNLFYEVKRLSYRDITFFESQSRVNIPYYYAVFGRKFRLIPQPTGTFDGRIWYLRQPEQLVKKQGRITVINSVSNYVIVDGIGGDLSTETDNLQSYINVIDGQTGEIKGSLQVKTLANNRITFKSTPTRTTVENRTISTAISSFTGDNAIEQDDYVCLVFGTSVPFFKRPTNNFIIQYSVAELTRKLGGPADMEERVLARFEEQVERSWVGREHVLRVKKANKNWNLPFQRHRYFQSNN